MCYALKVQCDLITNCVCLDVLTTIVSLGLRQYLYLTHAQFLCVLLRWRSAFFFFEIRGKYRHNCDVSICLSVATIFI